VLLDEEPLGLVVGAVGGVVHADESPLAFHLGAIHLEFEVTGAEAGVDVFAAELRPPAALIPDHDCAAAVLALGDDPFEATVLEGMVFDFDGEAALLWVVAGALGDGPAFENATPAEAEVVMEVRGCVFLDDEGKAARGGGLAHGEGVGVSAGSGGFVGGAEVAHGAIAFELRIDGRGSRGGVRVSLARGVFGGGFLCGHDGVLRGFTLWRCPGWLGFVARMRLGSGLDERGSFPGSGLGRVDALCCCALRVCAAGV